MEGRFCLRLQPLCYAAKVSKRPDSNGGSGSWDESGVMYPAMIMVEDKFYIYYWGWSADQSKRVEVESALQLCRNGDAR